MSIVMKHCPYFENIIFKKWQQKLLAAFDKIERFCTYSIISSAIQNNICKSETILYVISKCSSSLPPSVSEGGGLVCESGVSEGGGLVCESGVSEGGGLVCESGVV